MKDKVKSLIFILVLGSICTSLLLGIRAYTAPVILRYQELMLKTAVLGAAGIVYGEKDPEEVFSQSIKEQEINGFKYYVSPANLYIFEFKGRGLWGMIEGIITLNRDLKTIENISIIAQEETPGLGARITEDEFLNQFKKKIVDPKLVLVMRKKAAGRSEIDAITGATITSDAFTNIINESVQNYQKVMRK